jgi:hypothetical protein
MPKVNNWRFLPWMDGKRLVGNVTGHAQFRDGTFITTSPVVAFVNGAVVVTKSGSAYELGSKFGEGETK